MYLQRRASRLGWKVLAQAARVWELAPSDAITRSWVADSRARSGAGVRKWVRTPSSAHRSCRMRRSRWRLMAAKPCPPEVVTVPR